MRRDRSNETDPRRGIQSVEVGFSLLRALADAGGKLPLKALAERAQMSPSKAHLYLVSFTRVGLVIQDPATLRYGLGATTIQLGLAAINQMEVMDVARQHLDAVLDRTGASVSLNVWGNHGPTIIYRLDGELPVPLSVRVGFVLPLLTTATGRTFMAHLPEHYWRSLAKAEAKRAPDAWKRATGALEEIRATCISITNSETQSGFFGISSPIFGGDASICAAVTALGLSAEADLRPDGAIAVAIRQAANKISADLGASLQPPDGSASSRRIRK